MFIALRKSSTAGFGCKLIDSLSRGNGYCHAELVFSDGLAFSSTPKDELNARPAGGPRFTYKIAFNPDKWDIFPLDTNGTEERAIYKRARKIEAEARIDDGGYDEWGCYRFVIPFVREHPKDWFCSEVVVEALRGIVFPEDIKPWRVAPNDLPQLVKEYGG